MQVSIRRFLEMLSVPAFGKLGMKGADEAIYKMTTTVGMLSSGLNMFIVFDHLLNVLLTILSKNQQEIDKHSTATATLVAELFRLG